MGGVGWGRGLVGGVIGVEEMQQRSQLSPSLVCVLDIFTCMPVCMHLMSQMLVAGVCASLSCVRVPCMILCLTFLTSVLQQRAVNLTSFVL